MDTRLIFLDIDGTFISPGRMDAPDSAVQAVRAARAKPTASWSAGGGSSSRAG